MLVTPAIDIDPANMMYYDLGEQGNMDAIVSFGTITDPTDVETFTELAVHYPTLEWETFEYDISNLGDSETEIYFAWKMATSNDNYFSLDNVILTTDVLFTYCEATTLDEDEWISNVLCGSIDNDSDWQGAVADYTDISTSIEAGSSESITVTNGNPYEADSVSVWVDWNNDFEFGIGSDEEFVLTNDGTGATFTGAIAAPEGTPEGDYRLRVRMVDSDVPEPCGVSSYGEVEDYTITVGAGGPTGKLQGFIRDAVTNLAIDEGTISALSADDGTVSVTTPFGSHYSMLLTPGTYDVSCSAEGYVTETAYDLLVQENMNTNNTFYLTPGDGQNVTTGVNDVNKNHIFVYPNPAREAFHIDGADIRRVLIMNYRGQLVYQNDEPQANNVIHTSNMPSGIYILKVETESALRVEKIVIEK